MNTTNMDLIASGQTLFPAGNYQGMWSSYTLTIGSIKIETKTGIRGDQKVRIVVTATGDVFVDY